MSKFKSGCWKTACAIAVLCASTAIVASGQTFTTLVNFNGDNGADPYAPLLQGADGNLCGVTPGGGIAASCPFSLGCGTIFKMTPSGTLTTLYSFCVQVNCADGTGPTGLVLGADLNFYGLTQDGGANSNADFCAYGCGTFFKISPGGTLTTLRSFCAQSNCTDGAFPYGLPVQATDGNFYGTTYTGGANGKGTVFKLTSAGTLTTLYSFCAQANCPDGSHPVAGLIQAIDGNFYGTTLYGGTKSCPLFSNGCGTVFRITAGGTLTTLHAFDYTDDGAEASALIQATNGNLYGTAFYGGAGTVGTVFKITPGGTLTTLHGFDFTEGAYPGGVVQATDGNLYGTTDQGGSGCYGGLYPVCGAIYKIVPGGAVTTLHSFGDGGGGSNPTAPLVQATNGIFYGTASDDVESEDPGDGTVFSLAVGLGPFVETVPGVRKAGTKVAILGNNLTGTSSVTFNGIAATFTVASNTEISATVPSNATTGPVQVVTPNRTLSSNVPFRVLPVVTTFSPTSGAPGTSVVITGNGLTGATTVTFGGVKATSFTVNSYTQITVTVPTGAKTGPIGIATPGGTATSPASFTVN